jgi:hypothetical protein
MATHTSLKLSLVAAAACLFCMATTVQSMAQSGPARPDPYAPYHAQQSYSAYLGQDGTYNSLADFSRSIEGTPCDIACTARAQSR